MPRPDPFVAAEKIATVPITATERKVVASLQKALREIRATMSELYERYADSGGHLTRAEMTRYNRLATAERQLVDELNVSIRETTKAINRLPEEAYNAGFFTHAWAIDQSASVRISWGRISVERLKAVLANPLRHIALEQYGQQARAKIRSALVTGMNRGLAYQEMMREMRDSLNTTAERAIRIARTEGNRAVNAGIIDVYDKAEDEGVEGDVVWTATLDDRTRDSHGSMDGRVRDEDGYFTLPNGERARAPGDDSLSAAEVINCRCRTRYEVNSVPPKYRRTRDEGVIEYQTYGEWAAERGYL